MYRWSTTKLQLTTLPTTNFPFSTTGASWTALRETKKTQSMKPLNGAVASSKPSMPREVTQAAPNWCLFKARAGMLRPSLLVTKLAKVRQIDTTKEGRWSASPVLLLCYSSPLFFLILVPFSLMKEAISWTLFLSALLTRIIARSFPPSISTRQLTSTD